MSCVLQAETGKGKSHLGVLQLFPQCHLHAQTSTTNWGSVIQYPDSWSNNTSPKSNAYCHSPTPTSTRGPPTPIATSTTSCHASTLSSSSSTCTWFAFTATCNPDHSTQPSPVMGGLLRCRRILSNRSFQTLEPVQSFKSHPIWALVTLTSAAWWNSTDEVKNMHNCDYLHVTNLWVMQHKIDLLTLWWSASCTYLEWNDCLFDKIKCLVGVNPGVCVCVCLNESIIFH